MRDGTTFQREKAGLYVHIPFVFKNVSTVILILFPIAADGCSRNILRA